MISQIRIVIDYFILILLCLRDVGEGREALRRILHNRVCFGLDITPFSPLMHGFIMQQQYITI